MQIGPVNNSRNNNYYPEFGHTFRVNICTLNTLSIVPKAAKTAPKE